MGANEQRVDSEGTSIDGFVTLLNDFAALPEQALSQRARGRDGLRRVRHAPSSTAPTLSRPRAGFAGFLAILLVGGLGFTIWTEPHGCLGCDDALMVALSAQASDTARPPSRFQYTANLGEILKHEPFQWALSLDQASKTAEVRGEEPLSQPMPKFAATQIDANGAPSPMTTSATGRLYAPQTLTESVASRHGRRIRAVAEEISDTEPKPLKQTAANEITDKIVPPPSVLSVERSPVNDISTFDAPVGERTASIPIPLQKPSQRSRTTAQPGHEGKTARNKNGRRSARRRRKNVKSAQSDNVPGWAKKMFDGNWQGRAFSYQDR